MTNPSSLPVKRIKSISLSNYRAYAEKYASIELPVCQNMLVYGENGSGKSSLFKALNNYLVSSVDNHLPFVKNRYFTNLDGEIKITFSDIDSVTNKPIEGTDQEFHFGSVNSNNTVNFIKDAALIKGFLDYTDLLDIYSYKVANPNLFKLIVLKLLGEHIPISSGGNFKFKAKWDDLQKDLIDKSYTRNDIYHKRAKAELPIFETHLRATLDEVFKKVKDLLDTYFPELDIKIDYQLAKLDFNYEYYKNDWFTNAELFLLVSKDGVVIPCDYRDILNEARMSAFAICLYLASLKCNPTRLELKILYLDDIFIGLDSGNRIPILDILIKEFSEYQVFISTYDRYTYEVAKRHLDSYAQIKWKSIELYVAKQFTPLSFDKPLIVTEVDEFGQGVHYLHHAHRPDYPAAANYFRKYAEKLLSSFLPSHEVRNDDYEMLQGWELGKLVNVAIKFLRKIYYTTPLMNELKNGLPTILHPLSHFNLSSPIYKKELLQIQNTLFQLSEYFHMLKTNFRLYIPQSQILKLKFTLGESDYVCYEIFCEEVVYLVNVPNHPLRFSIGKCRLKSTYRLTNTISSNPYVFNKNDTQFHYFSLNDAYEKLYTYIIGLPGLSNTTKVENYLTEFEINTKEGDKTLDTLLVW